MAEWKNGKVWEGFRDIPELRQDIEKPSNARWILRNIGINNANHPRLREILERAKATVRRER